MNTKLEELLLSPRTDELIYLEVVGKVSLEYVDDIKQDFYLSALTYFGKLKEEELTEVRFYSTCRTILRRSVVRHYRKSNRKIEKAIRWVAYNDCRPEDKYVKGAANNFFAFIIDDHNYEIVDVTIDYYRNRDKFNASERKILDFLFEDVERFNLKFQEVAELFKVHKSNTTRALKKLRSLYSA